MSDDGEQAPGAMPLAHFALMPGAAQPGPTTLEAALGSIQPNRWPPGPRFPVPPEALAETPSEPSAAAAQRDVAGSLVAERREWLLGVMDDQRRLSARASELPRRRDLSGQAFLDEFYAPCRPVVLEGVAADWPAVETWTADYLARIVGEAIVEYQGGRSGAADFELAKDRHKRSMPFDAFMAMIGDEDSEGNDAYITAYNSSSNAAAFAPLQADLGVLDAYLTPGEGMMWIGPQGTFTPLHFDLTNNLLVQLCGLKEFTLVPPHQTRFLYHAQHVFSEVHDLDDPDRLERFPLSAPVTPYEVILEPGDALFVPIGWWHQVRSLEFSAMLTYTNFRWANLGYAEYPAD